MGADCGDASTHAKVDDLQPPLIQTGATTTLKGSGAVDEDVPSATFSADVSAAGVKLVCLDVNTEKQELEVQAGTLAVTWADCGDASTHAKVDDLQPPLIQTGATMTLKGTGAVDEDVPSATFS